MGKYQKNGVLSRVRISPVYVFFVLMMASLAWLCAALVESRGKLLTSYFFYDTLDAGMDFFHSLEYLKGSVPYERYHTLYPPLANLLFLGFFKLMPATTIAMWSRNFSGSVAMRGTELDLRLHQAPLLAFTIFMVIAACFAASVITSYLNKHHRHGAGAASLSLLLSYGCLYCYERGNILFLVVPLVLFFLCYRNDDNFLMRELALICLAIAAGLKLYPALFGVLLLKDKKFFAATRAVLYGILSVVLPLFAFKEGLEGLTIWLNIMQKHGDKATEYLANGNSFANILYRICEMDVKMSLKPEQFQTAGLCVMGILLVCALILPKDWQSVLAVTMAILLYQRQPSYIYCLFCIPMAVFLAEEEKLTFGNLIPFLLMSGMLLNIPLFYDRTEDTHPEILLRQGLSLLIVLWCMLVAVAVLLMQSVAYLQAAAHRKPQPQPEQEQIPPEPPISME